MAIDRQDLLDRLEKAEVDWYDGRGDDAFWKVLWVVKALVNEQPPREPGEGESDG